MSKLKKAIVAAMLFALSCFAQENLEGKNGETIDVEHHYADLGDVRLHYVTAGVGEPLVLLHGWPQTWYQWREIIPLLADRYEIIAPDLRGLGDSSRPETGYNKITVADDIWRLVSDHLGHERWKLVGHDWGSTVAYALAASHPEVVRQLVLIEGALPIGGARNEAGIPMHELNQSGLGWHMTFHRLPDLPEELVQGREEVYFRWFYHNLGHPSYEISKEAFEEYVRAYSQPGALRAGFNYYRTWWPQDVAELTELMRDKKLTMPVLTVFGSQPFRQRPDLKWSKNPIADRLRAVATDVSEALIEQSGHWVPEEQPEMLAKHLIEFFNRTDSAKE